MSFPTTMKSWVSYPVMVAALFHKSPPRVRRLKRLRKKKANSLSSTTILFHYRDSETTVLFVRKNWGTTTLASLQIYNRTERVLQRELIHEIRRDLALLESDHVSTLSLTSSSMTNDDWNKVDRITNQTVENE